MIDHLNKTYFYFARHGQTDWNKKRLCQGQKDIPLNEAGILEAQLLADYCRGLEIECIISSPLKRALKTAEQIKIVKPNAMIYEMQNFSERSWGDLEGVSSKQMYAIELQEEKNQFYNPGFNIEPRALFNKRVFDAIYQAQQIHPHPLIISHGRVFWQLCHIMDITTDRQIPNCRLCKFIFNDNRWKFEICM